MQRCKQCSLPIRDGETLIRVQVHTWSSHPTSDQLLSGEFHASCYRRLIGAPA